MLYRRMTWQNKNRADIGPETTAEAGQKTGKSRLFQDSKNSLKNGKDTRGNVGKENPAIPRKITIFFIDMFRREWYIIIVA